MSGDPRQAQRFRFAGREFDPATGEARLHYRVDDDPPLTERLRFPHAPWPAEAGRQAGFEQALALLHAIAGVSYYKAGLAPRIEPGDLAVDPVLAEFLAQTYEHGLAEFAWVNGLDLAGRIAFPLTAGDTGAAPGAVLPPRALVAIGGGKDSLVCLEMLRAAGIEVQPVCVGASPLIARTVQAAGLPLIAIERHLAPGLAELNRAGAWNGHVPVTAINSAILVCAALLYGYRWVVFANERSADEATRLDASGRPVNHQWSKSFEFEQAFRRVLRIRVGAEPEYFSLLRPFSEIDIARKFSKLSKYHKVFSSCNRHFHLDGPRLEGRWCGACPKCRFTTLALAPFLSPERVKAIFGVNLLDMPLQEPGFRALAGLGEAKPFECVGTEAESRAALAALAQDPNWRTCHVVQALAGEVAELGREALAEHLGARGGHAIPDEVLARVAL